MTLLISVIDNDAYFFVIIFSLILIGITAVIVCTLIDNRNMDDDEDIEEKIKDRKKNNRKWNFFGNEIKLK
jgi:hypothetical protein